MPTRPQSTKIRAKRIGLTYFKESHPFRRWKFILSVVAPVVAGLWLLVVAVQGNQRVYNAGPVSTAHAMFEKDCKVCHGPGPAEGGPLVLASADGNRGYWLNVSDRACQTCHAGPRHNTEEAFTPRCATCHVEHFGRTQLGQIGDRHCTQCHADLKTKEGGRPPAFHKNIPSLSQHPEFAVTVREGQAEKRVRLDQKAELKDTAQVKLNHAKHLKVNLKGIEDLQKKPGVIGIAKVKDGAQLSCSFCHQPDERGQYLQPVSYPKHCADCHPLDFDGRFPDQVVPHDKPAIVHAYLRGTLSEAFDQCQAIPAGEAGKAVRARCVELELAKAPAEPAAEADRPRGGRRGAAAEEAPPADEPRGGRLRGRAAEPEPAPAPAPDAPRGARLRGQAQEEAPPADAPRGRPGRGGEAAPAPAPTSWVGTQVENTEPGLFKQRCEYCHTVTKSGSSVPDVALTAIPNRWLPHARFDHGVHRPMGCAECHKAATSTETKDVLLPTVATCRECHTPKVGARTDCVECHRYHDKSKERDPDGPFKIRELLSGTSASRTDRPK
jgi:hypothetical protein